MEAIIYVYIDNELKIEIVWLIYNQIYIIEF